MKYSEIPKFVEKGNWECEYPMELFVEAIEKFKADGLQLNPDFQRGHVWTEEQQVSYIEYLLQGGTTGRVVYFNNPSGYSGDFVCVDGLQRITAVQRFVNNEIRVFGSYYADFEGTLKNVFMLRININNLRSRKQVLQWYIEMNSGGVVHTQEEIGRVKELLLMEK